MGALTLKSFPFELRGWELEKINNIDLTDSFGSTIKVSLNNKQIIQIEPATLNNNSIWLHDKARQFFDSLSLNTNEKYLNLDKIIQKLYKIIYLFELCNLKYSLFNYLIIVYGNLSINNLCLLNIFSNKFNFIKLKNSQNNNFNNNLESNYLLNKKFSKSSFCLLISTNLRFEGSVLNLSLKQKLLKGNFKVFSIGSFINLTFNINFLGNSCSQILKTVTEGTHLICQDIKLAKSPMLLFNSNFFQKNSHFLTLLKCLNKNIIVNSLNLTVFELNSHYLNKPEKLSNKDFLQFSAIYFVNLALYHHNIINKIIKTNIMFLNKFNNKPLIKKLYLNQNFYKQKIHSNNYLNKSLYLPVKTFVETKEKFLTNTGLIKQTNKLISSHKFTSNWKILRNIFNFLKKNRISLFVNVKTNLKVNLNFKKSQLKMYTYLYCEPNINLNKKSIKIVYNNSTNNFFLKTNVIKTKKLKFNNSKLSFFLNDFFIGGVDGFSENSFIMKKLSKTNLLETTNFF